MSDLSTLHAWFAHVNVDSIKHMARNKVIEGLNLDSSHYLITCGSRIVKKSARAPIPKQEKAREVKPFNLAHSNVCGPMIIEYLEGSHYFGAFIDDNSRFCYFYTLKTKQEAVQTFVKWLRFDQNRFGFLDKSNTVRSSALGALLTDNGGEYMSNRFRSHFEKLGIAYQQTLPHNPHWNGNAERFNCSLIDMVRLMLDHKNLSATF